MFASAEEIYEAAKTKPRYGVPYVNSVAEAEQYLQNTLADALANNQSCKHDRPWNIVDFSKKLDPKQPWIGFEFETGFDDKEEYKQFINWLWAQQYVAIDREGTGKFPVEVAFPPQELDSIEKDGALLVKAVQFIKDKGLTPALNPTTFTRRDVGIHAGISTEKYRTASCDERYAAVGLLAGILDKLAVEQKKELYGRSALHWGTASYRNTYVELKMFRAIPEVERVQGYVEVVKRCTVLLDMCIDNPQLKMTGNEVYTFLSGNEVATKQEVA